MPANAKKSNVQFIERYDADNPHIRSVGTIETDEPSWTRRGEWKLTVDARERRVTLMYDWQGVTRAHEIAEVKTDNPAPTFRGTSITPNLAGGYFGGGSNVHHTVSERFVRAATVALASPEEFYTEGKPNRIKMMRALESVRTLHN